MFKKVLLAALLASLVGVWDGRADELRRGSFGSITNSFAGASTNTVSHKLYFGKSEVAGLKIFVRHGASDAASTGSSGFVLKFNPIFLESDGTERIDTDLPITCTLTPGGATAKQVSFPFTNTWADGLALTQVINTSGGAISNTVVGAVWTGGVFRQKPSDQ